MEEKMDLRIRKTYLALHNSFTQLLEERRFEDLTVNELCDRAMIRRTTFYKHFADKYEYFSFYIREITSTFQDRLAPDVAEDEIDAYLLHMCRELLRFVKEHDRLVQNIQNSSMFPMLLSILLDQISFDMVQVLRRAKPNDMNRQMAEGIASFIAGGITNTLFQMLKQNIEPDEDHFLNIVSRFLQAKGEGGYCLDTFDRINGF